MAVCTDGSFLFQRNKRNFDDFPSTERFRPLSRVHGGGVLCPPPQPFREPPLRSVRKGPRVFLGCPPAMRRFFLSGPPRLTCGLWSDPFYLNAFLTRCFTAVRLAPNDRPPPMIAQTSKTESNPLDQKRRLAPFSFHFPEAFTVARTYLFFNPVVLLLSSKPSK